MRFGQLSACTRGQVFHGQDSEYKANNYVKRRRSVSRVLSIIYTDPKADDPVLGESFTLKNVPTVPSLSGTL